MIKEEKIFSYCVCFVFLKKYMLIIQNSEFHWENFIPVYKTFQLHLPPTVYSAHSADALLVPPPHCLLLLVLKQYIHICRKTSDSSLSLVYFPLHDDVHLFFCKWHSFIPLKDWIVHVYLCISHLIYPPICWWHLVWFHILAEMDLLQAAEVPKAASLK